jgi:hypothetical protein
LLDGPSEALSRSFCELEMIHEIVNL